jgi:hypothetical protein
MSVRKTALVLGLGLTVLACVVATAIPISAATPSPSVAPVAADAAGPVAPAGSTAPAELESSATPTSALQHPTFAAQTVKARGHVAAVASSLPYTQGSLIGTWTYDMFDARAPRWQEPDETACTAASVVSMLNTIAFNGADEALVWQPNVSFSVQETILGFERTHMTMRRSSAGSDAHGWRNALNYFGWGSLQAGVYADVAYGSLAQAEKGLVSALARYHKPVGILTQYGRHAQFITGYKVYGENPATGSTNFRIVGVYMTDPWRSGRYRDTFVTPDTWRHGWYWLRWERYLETDSPYRDPIDGHVGRSEWVGKWVTVQPTR